MKNTLPFQTPLGRRTWLLAMLLGLLWAACPASQAFAQGGMLTPATITECSGNNSGTITLTGYTGTILRFESSTDGGTTFTNIPNSATPNHTYTNLTQTTVFRAVVRTGGKDYFSTVATVIVSQPPAATITSTGPTTFCQQGVVMLVAGPSNGASGTYGYQFLRNGVNIPGATNQMYTGAVVASGTYSVRVTDALGCSAISPSVSITVNPTVVLTLTASGPTTFCEGGSVLLTAMVTGQGANNYTYQFMRNGAAIAGATTSTYTATTSGRYTVTVYNPNTCSSTATPMMVTVNPKAIVTLSYPSTSYCQSGPNPTPTYSPTGGTFTANSSNLSISASTGVINLAASQPGSYTITYTGGSPCPSSATFNVSIFAPPTANFSYVPNTGCAGTMATLMPTLATGATGGTFTASPTGLSLQATTGTIDLSQSQAGTYTIINTIAAASGCAVITATAQVVLTAQPVATLTAGGPTTFCQGGSVQLTAAGGIAGSSYQFLLNGQPIAGATTATYSAKAGGAYSVRISNGSCSATSATTTLTVNPSATPILSYSAGSFCQGTGTAAATVTGGASSGGFSASPTGLSLDAGTGTVNLSLSQAGVYTIIYAGGSPCPSTASATLTISAMPAQPVLTQSGSTLSTPAITGATYQFYLNGILLPGTSGPSITATQPGSYTVVATVAACASLASAPVVLTVTATHKTPAPFDLTVSPNPTPNGHLTIRLAGPLRATQLTVLNGLGQVLRTCALPATVTSTDLDLSALASGVYMLRATTADGTATWRIVRQ